MCFTVLCEWCFEHEATDVVAALKVRLPHQQLFLIKVWRYMCHLDVCKLWIELSLIYLHKITKQVKVTSNYRAT